ncbi:DUF6801 domain-containing protein [Amycolatopsis vancoresmycina]|uniref:DUF6801 domain-containing protein n=1 Tax=Amycolatopsis vancoresmycina DSM 44592 TaxID=1292037 RepID=R1HSI6_9PSEU|nr:DUF6801 domain-containing protein [Amycolatopsis vancoresmycina]EOD66510.1 hypothetical protein H480_20952 [Amycolatopsis vancoresmycina DSM 44592]
MRFGTALAAALLVTGLAAGTAHAGTVTLQTGTVPYRCSYPGAGLQNTTFAASFSTDDVVAAGSTITLRNVSLTQVLPSPLRALLASLGYDGIRGVLNASITAANAYPDAPISGILAEQTIPASGPMTFHVAAGDVTTGAGLAGTIEFSLSAQLGENLEFRKKATGTWVAWSSACRVAVPVPPGAVFQPDIVIS